MELAVLMGLQGAGKSSFYRRHFETTHAHVSKDNFRNASNPELRQRSLVDEALLRGCSVVVDNTNVAAADRAFSIAQGKAAGAQIKGYYFASRIADCMERNNLRIGRERVPDIAIVSAAKRLELPSYAEGFDELFHVSLGSGGEFIVAPWKTDTKS